MFTLKAILNGVIYDDIVLTKEGIYLEIDSDNCPCKGEPSFKYNEVKVLKSSQSIIILIPDRTNAADPFNLIPKPNYNG